MSIQPAKIAIILQTIAFMREKSNHQLMPTTVKKQNWPSGVCNRNMLITKTYCCCIAINGVGRK